jgi:hypothetical protein
MNQPIEADQALPAEELTPEQMRHVAGGQDGTAHAKPH